MSSRDVERIFLIGRINRSSTEETANEPPIPFANMYSVGPDRLKVLAKDMAVFTRLLYGTVEKVKDKLV